MRPTPWMLTAALLLCACDSGDEPAAPTAIPVANREAPKPPPADPTPVPAPPGPAWIATEQGLAKLDGGAFTAVAGAPKEIHRLLRGPDGKLWMASNKGVWTLSGDAIQLIPSPSIPRSIDAIGLDEAGRLWATGFQGYAVWDGTRWESHKATEVAAAEDNFSDVLFDSAGRTWLLGRKGLYLKTGETWTAQDLHGVAPAFFDELEAAPDGTLYMSHSDGVMRLGDGGWMSIPLGSVLRDEETLRAAPDGRVYSATNSSNVQVMKGDVIDEITITGKTFAAYRFAGIAVDQRGRLWLAAEDGLVIKDGATEIMIPSVAVPALGGKLTALLVEAGGPLVPTAIPIPRGTVIGRFVKDGQPLAGADVELCMNSSFMFSTTPCGEDPTAARGTTDAEGKFKLEGVSYGLHSVLVKKEGKWASILNASCCDALTEGGTQDLGELNLSN